jgi:hypothetical protein
MNDDSDYEGVSSTVEPRFLVSCLVTSSIVGSFSWRERLNTGFGVTVLLLTFVRHDTSLSLDSAKRTWRCARNRAMLARVCVLLSVVARRGAAAIPKLARLPWVSEVYRRVSVRCLFTV